MSTNKKNPHVRGVGSNEIILHSGSPLDKILSRLEGVRKSGKGYISRCPCHSDMKPSLSICETNDLTVLMHCFAGCKSVSVLQALGLELADLYPKISFESMTPQQRTEARLYAQQVGWKAALEVLVTESGIVYFMSRFVIAGFEISQNEIKRLELASDRIWDAREKLYVR